MRVNRELTTKYRKVGLRPASFIYLFIRLFILDYMEIGNEVVQQLDMNEVIYAVERSATEFS